MESISSASRRTPKPVALFFTNGLVAVDGVNAGDIDGTTRCPRRKVRNAAPLDRVGGPDERAVEDVGDGRLHQVAILLMGRSRQTRSPVLPEAASTLAQFVVVTPHAGVGVAEGDDHAAGEWPCR